MDLHIQIDDINVTEITTTSGIFSGENYHANWSAMSKTNTGLELRGEGNLSKDCINVVYDPDAINMHRVR
jgi:hypothetical protein